MTNLVETAELVELFKLLEKKQNPVCSIQDQQIFYSKACEFLQRNPKCIWCRFTPIAVELLHLYALPPNPMSQSYDSLTRACLQSCSNCINVYYIEKSTLLKRLSDHYEEETLAEFNNLIMRKDSERILFVLRAFIESNLDCSDKSLLYTLYEILSFPSCLSSSQIDEVFCQTLERLIVAKKMLKVSQLMSGLFYLTFHHRPNIRSWALSVLRTKLAHPGNHEFELDFSKWSKMLDVLGEQEVYSILSVVVHATPSEFANNLLFVIRHIKNDVSNKSNLLLLCLILDKLSVCNHREIGTSHEIFSMAVRLFQIPDLSDVVNASAKFPINPTADILDYDYGTCVTQWIRLLCNLACKWKDERLLNHIQDNIFKLLLVIRSHDARNNLVSLLINIVHHCTTSEDMVNERFYIPCVNKVLEFLVDYFLKHCNPQKPSVLLLETFKTCIQFDCNEIVHISTTNQPVWENNNLFKTVLKLFDVFTGNKSAYEMMLKIGAKLFIESDAQLYGIALQYRKPYLDFIFRSWALFGTAGSLQEPSYVMLIFICIGTCDIIHDRRILEQFSNQNAVSLATCPSTWLKRAKLLEDKVAIEAPSVPKLISFVSLYCSTIFKRNGTCLIGAAPNALHLKLHLLSASAGFLSFIVSVKSQSGDKLPLAFFESAMTLSFLISIVGLDALKAFLNENQGMLRRIKHVPYWISYLSKNLFLLEMKQMLDLIPFLKEVILLAVHLKVSLPSLEQVVQHFCNRLRDEPNTLLSLKSTLILYQREFQCPLNLTFPEARPRAEIDLEDVFLQRLREESSKEKPVRTASSQSLDSKPASKLGMLKQDLIREQQAIASKVVPQTRKKLNAAVHHTAKTTKLDVHRNDIHSSDVDAEAVDLVGTFDNDLSNIGNSVRDGSRTVKFISYEDTGVDVPQKTRRNLDDEYIELDSQVSSVKKLHRYLLSLDIDALDDRSLEGVAPKPIPDRFVSVDEYLEIFEPLLLFECRAQLVQAKLDLDSAACYSVKVLAISSVDEYHEVTIGLEGDESIKIFSEQDLVMARLDVRESKSEILGMVIQSSLKGNRTEALIKFRFRPHQHQYQVELRIGLIWKVKKLCNWVTCIREYGALHSINDLRLCKAILNPGSIPVDTTTLSNVIDILEKSLEVNRSQAQAIAVALNNPNPFTLIQGPPGTGKTKTILGMVGALFGRPYPSLSSKLRPQRLLICAPSNAAIDEIVRRLKCGVYDCYHQKFSPKVLRLGSHEMIHEEVKDVTLEAVIERTFKSQCKDSIEMLQKQKQSINELKKDLDFAEKMGRAEDISALKQQLWQLKDSMKKNNAFIEGNRQGLRNKIVSEAHIICTTLSSSGIDLLSKMQFDVVIIDEACQAVEISGLIPLQYGCKNCILVGGISKFSFSI